YNICDGVLPAPVTCDPWRRRVLMSLNAPPCRSVRMPTILAALGLAIVVCIGLIVFWPSIRGTSANASGPDDKTTEEKKNDEKKPAKEDDDLQQAPELEGGVAWLNTASPLRLKDLRGKFVLLDFWTFCCINCIHTLPDLARLEKKFANQLVVIGVHAPKF